MQAERALVAEVAGEVDCVVSTVPVTPRHLERDLPLCCVTTVTTSRAARRHGLAGPSPLEALDGALRLPDPKPHWDV